MNNNQFDSDLTTDMCPADTIYDIYNVKQVNTDDMICKIIWTTQTYLKLFMIFIGFLLFTISIRDSFDYIFSLCKMNRGRHNLFVKAFFLIADTVIIFACMKIYPLIIFYIDNY